MSFEDLKVYQKDVVRLLDNSFKRDRLSSIYLFSGPRGTGKMEAARYFASLVLCDVDGSCGQCSQCIRLAKGINENFYVIKPDGDQIKKEQIIALQEEFNLSSDNHKVFVIDGIDKLSKRVANTLLKFIEELKEGSYGILLTEDMASVLPTIKSRAQVVHFLPINKRIIRDDLVSIGLSKENANVISNSTYNKEVARKMANDSMITDMINLCVHISSSFEGDDSSILIMNTEGKFLLDEASKEYHQLFFEMLVSFTTDKIKYLSKENLNEDDLTFVSSIKEIKIIRSIEEEIDILGKLLEYKKRLPLNVNKELLYSSLFIDIKRC